MKFIYLILALACVSAGGGPALPQAKKKQAVLQSPKAASSSSATSIQMVVLRPKAPSPAVSLAFGLDTNNTAMLNLKVKSSADVVLTNFVFSWTNLYQMSNGEYVVTVTNLARHQYEFELVAISANGVASSLVQKSYCWWQVQSNGSIWLAKGDVNVGFVAQSNWVYKVNVGGGPSGPWFPDTTITGSNQLVAVTRPVVNGGEYFQITRQ